MANSKVQLADGTTLIDLTSDTVTPQTLVAPATAHASNGEQITGVVNLANAGTAVPLADSGSGSVGNSTLYARQDHVHPAPTYRTITPTIVDPLPTGISRCFINVGRCGNVVEVHFDIVLTTTLSSYTIVATNMPTPAAYPISSGNAIPLMEVQPISMTSGSTLELKRFMRVVVRNSDHAFRISRGEAGEYYGHFTYLTSDD